jgi:large subunit ribosomal protein L17
MGYRKLGRTTDHRKAMLRNLVTSLIVNGEVITTEAKAKEVKRLVDKMITLGKVEINNKQVDGKENPRRINAKRRAAAFLTDCVTEEFIKAKQETGKTRITPKVRATVNKKQIMDKLFNELAEQFKEKNGGYTAIYKLGPRRGDAAPMALLKLV